MRADDFGKLVLRLTVGGLMLFHGIHKLQNGVTGIEGMLVAEGLPSWVAYGVYLAEIVAPILLIIGWGTRIGAGIIMINMIGALLLVHANDLTTISERGGAWAVELPMFYLLSSLSLAIMGPGAIGLAGSKVRKPMIIRVPKRERVVVRETRYPTPPPSPTATY